MTLEIIPVWFVMWLLTWPALLAKIQNIYGEKSRADSGYREDLAFCIGLSLLPPVWVITPFMTGFYEHGFQLGKRDY